MSVYRSISMKVTVGEVTSIGNYFLGGNVFNAQLQNSSDKYKYVSLHAREGVKWVNVLTAGVKTFFMYFYSSKVLI